MVQKKTFKWHDAKNYRPEDGTIVLADIDMGGGEHKLVTAVYLADVRQWTEMLTNLRAGHNLGGVYAWSYIPTVRFEEKGGAE